MTPVLVVLAAQAVAVLVVTFVTRGQGLAEVEQRFTTSLSPDEVRARGVPVLLPLMAHHGYALREVDGDDLAIFRRAHRPRWTLYLAAVAWPLGFAALTRRIVLEVAVTLESTAEGSAVVFRGEMTSGLRRDVRASFEE